MRLDAFASMPHYAEHLWPVWNALPEGARGTFWKAGPMMRDHAGAELIRGRYDCLGDVVLVASAADAKLAKGRQLVLVEHGAGQAYTGVESPSYAGGPGWDRCLLFLCPNAVVAARWADAYPLARVDVVGSPKLDRLHRPAGGLGLDAPDPVVALTFHWDNRICPESTWAFPHYRDSLPELRDWLGSVGYRLVGHGHPRAQAHLARVWQQLGVEFWPSFDQVARGAQVLIGDNTSALPEFASLGRPVVWLNAPQYRRHVHHGGRFWTWPEGQPTADGPGDLPYAVARACNPLPEETEARRAMVASIYSHTDGHASERAAAAIVEVIGA